MAFQKLYKKIVSYILIEKKNAKKQQLQLYHDSGTIKHSENLFWRHLYKPVNV